MNRLKEYISLLDNNNLNDTDHLEIENSFQKIRDDFIKENDQINASLAQLEMEVFSFTKIVENNKLKLSFRFSGKQKDKDGNDIPFEWPDSNTYIEDNFEYIHNRFVTTKNFFCKKEYGLFLLLSSKSKYKSNEIAKEVINSTFELCLIYLKFIDLNKKDDKHYSIYFINSVKLAFVLSKSRINSDNEIKNLHNKIRSFIFDTLINWNIEFEYSLSVIGRITKLILSNFDDFKNLNLNILLEKFYEYVKIISPKDIYGGIDLAKIGNRFEKKFSNNENSRWLKLIAENYEKLANNAEEKKENVTVTFYEEALKYYKELNDLTKIKEVEAKYLEIKNKGYGFGITKTEIPQEETRRTYEKILKFANDAPESDIINFLISTPMFITLDELTKLVEEQIKKPSLLNLVGKTVVDKRGYTVEVYDTEEQRKEFMKLELFGFNFQISTNDLWWFFIESMKLNKLNLDLIINYLERTWIGKSYSRIYNGEIKDVNPLEVIRPGLYLLFSEFEKALKDFEYKPNLICSIDSLTMKIEYLIRFFCEELNIPTYRVKNDSKNLKEEKNIYDFLDDEKLKSNLLKDDIFFIKYILLSKMGKNLRHEIAHGLMDFNDYDPFYAILLLCIILKLSSYEFVNTKM